MHTLSVERDFFRNSRGGGGGENAHCKRRGERERRKRGRDCLPHLTPVPTFGGQEELLWWWPRGRSVPNQMLVPLRAAPEATPLVAISDGGRGSKSLGCSGHFFLSLF